ncbi:renalase-like [Lineus longissimus]|uniref:renalase-like n=1 Tax=Lineus longissimus TaxID=88925 RepID=UPI002B4D49FE
MSIAKGHLSVNMVKKILIVGCGVTGAASASLLQKTQTDPQKFNVTIFEKSRGTGGRMNTSRSSTNQQTVDLGAQYISVRPNYAQINKSFHEELLSSGVLQPLTGVIEGDNNLMPDGTLNYTAPGGIGAIPKHFLKQSDADVSFSTHVSSIDLDPFGTYWQVKTLDKPDEIKSFDAVLLTIPVPQILQLKGNIQNMLDEKKEIKEKLAKVAYSSRYALGLYFPPEAKISVTWAAKYFWDDPCIRFVSIDDRKRGKDGVGHSLCVHTSVPFGLKHLEEDKEAVQPIIMDHLRKLIPDLPQPTETKCQKWRYSQVYKGYEGSPGCVVLQDSPLLVLAGDSFIHSNLDACLVSAKKTADVILNHGYLAGNL